MRFRLSDCGRSMLGRRQIERAVAEREIVRTWPMRGTLHFLAAADVHWMLELLTPRILQVRRRVRRNSGSTTRR